jgi:hypothetical protein
MNIVNIPFFYILSGAIIGFIYFLYKLESPGMGNVLFRIDSSGNKLFSLESLLEIMKSPFTLIQFWTYSELYPINWILTTGLGGLFGLISYEIISQTLYKCL